MSYFKLTCRPQIPQCTMDDKVAILIELEMIERKKDATTMNLRECYISYTGLLTVKGQKCL